MTVAVAEVVLAERDGAVGIARLNRPDARNALSPELMERLVQIVEEWDAEEEVRCIVIAGGDDYFAAGADIKAMRDRTFQEKREGESLMQTTAIAHLGGATLDNEENYLIKKLFTAGLGMVCVSNQARI